MHMHLWVKSANTQYRISWGRLEWANLYNWLGLFKKIKAHPSKEDMGIKKKKTLPTFLLGFQKKKKKISTSLVGWVKNKWSFQKKKQEFPFFTVFDKNGDSHFKKKMIYGIPTFKVKVQSLEFLNV